MRQIVPTGFEGVQLVHDDIIKIIVGEGRKKNLLKHISQRMGNRAKVGVKSDPDARMVVSFLFAEVTWATIF